MNGLIDFGRVARTSLRVKFDDVVAKNSERMEVEIFQIAINYMRSVHHTMGVMYV